MSFRRKSHGRGRILAALAGAGAALGGVAFWRRRRRRGQQPGERPSPAPPESAEKEMPSPAETHEQ